MDNKPNHSAPGAGGHSNAPQNNVIMAVLVYLGILIVVPFLTDAKEDPFVKFHIKQGLTLLILDVVVWFFAFIPFIGWMFGWILWLVVFIFMIIGIMNAVQGQEKELPVIGGYAKSFNF